MGMERETKINGEAIALDDEEKTEWRYYDESGEPVHLSKVVHKEKPLIRIYPFSYSRERGVVRKRINEIELRGWNNKNEDTQLLKET